MSGKGKVGVVGSGVIGKLWAMIFASSGYEVDIYNVEPAKVDEAHEDIRVNLQKLQKDGTLRGKLSDSEQFSLIRKCYTLEDCISGSFYVQECVFESLELKKQIFREMDKYASNDVILSSSTSCYPASSFSEDLIHKSQVIVAHPINPPYYVPLVEIVPAPWTDPDVVTRTRTLMTEVGQTPVVLKKEVQGFAVNRIQYALIDECYRMYEAGIMSVEDIETTMRDGLGLQYAFIGALEACHLNANGMQDYLNRNSEVIHKISESFGPNPLMEGPTLDRLNEELCRLIPQDEISDRRMWRQARLADLATLKRSLDEKEKKS